MSGPVADPGAADPGATPPNHSQHHSQAQYSRYLSLMGKMYKAYTVKIMRFLISLELPPSVNAPMESNV